MTMFEFKMPKMGESMTEATIISWLKNVGDFVQAEETLVEVATDKVDSDIASPIAGTITAIHFQKNDVVPVGHVLATISPLASIHHASDINEKSHSNTTDFHTMATFKSNIVDNQFVTEIPNEASIKSSRLGSNSFLSPLIIAIAQKEHLSIEELQSIAGSGSNGRLQKSDVFKYLKNRKYPLESRKWNDEGQKKAVYAKPQIHFDAAQDHIVTMDRMRQLIAGHMVYSKQTSPHVTSFIEVDVTHLAQWRQDNKALFFEKTNEKLTFTPFFVQAVAKAVTSFPLMNVSVDNDQIIVHQNIHIGMATALPSGNLIVPVVKNANQKNIVSLAKEVNHLAEAARTNKLKPEQVQGSTITISNVGTFGSLMGTPIINQPEVAIIAFGLIKKRPEVISTPNGDEIAIRSMMYLSLSFDHRVVDGFLAGSFLTKVGQLLEEKVDFLY